MCRARSFDRKNQKITIINQSLLIREYNQRMRGLFDNAINMLCIKVRGKKWYWSLLENAFDAAMVNAWKLKVVCAKHDNSKVLSQFDFRMKIAEALLTQAVPNWFPGS